MPKPPRGPWLKLTPGRKVVIENLYQAFRVPSTSVTKALDLSAIAELRRQAHPSPSWTAIFMRAYALVAQRCPELRRSYISWPYPHLYEHPESVCAVVIEREWQGERVLLGKRFRAPERMTLPTIEGHLRRYKEMPVEEVGDFRRLLRLGRLPFILRRVVAWQHLSLSGYFRSRHLGTFLMSSIGNLGCSPVDPPSMLTSLLSLCPISPEGGVVLSVTFDHRVMDGGPVAQALNLLEEVLQTQLVAEVRGLGRAAA